MYLEGRIWMSPIDLLCPVWSHWLHEALRLFLFLHGLVYLLLQPAWCNMFAFRLFDND